MEKLNVNEMLLLASLKGNVHAISIIRKLHKEVGETLFDQTKTPHERIILLAEKLDAFAANFT